MRVAHAPAGEKHFALVRFIVAVRVLEELRLARMNDDHTAIRERETRRDAELIAEHSELIGATVALIPGIPQIKLLLFTQMVNGVLLPVILIAILSLVNNREIMGDYRNSVWLNIAGWATAIVISLLSLLLIGKTIADMV